MPKGIYKRSPEQIERIKKINIGRIHSEETLRKRSEQTRGEKNPFYGKKWSMEHRRQIGESKKDNKYMLGKRHSEEIKRKIGEAHRGKKRPPFSDETRRKLSESAKKRCGEKSPTWQGGKSFEPYDPAFNYALKRKVLERDKYTCQNCGLCKGLFTKKGDLVIHHIDGDKKNSNLANLVTLCKWCHNKYHRGING